MDAEEVEQQALFVHYEEELEMGKELMPNKEPEELHEESS